MSNAFYPSFFRWVFVIGVLIPFILIPQLLFSGYVVNFDKLHKNNLSSSEYVPLIGNLMTVRWSFEALAVEQFKNNKYERNIFKYQQGFSQNDWYSGFLINDILKRKMEECLKLKDSVAFREKTENNFYKLNFYIEQLDRLAGFGQQNGILKTPLSAGNFNQEIANETGKHLDSLSRHFQHVRRRYLKQLDSVNRAIENKTSNGNEEYAKLKASYHNNQLESLVLDRFGVKKYIETDKKIIQKLEPAYMIPTSKSGRTHFYAPYKQVGSLKIDTYWFNLLVLWVVSLLLYIALYYNLFQKIVEGLGNVKLKEASK